MRGAQQERQVAESLPFSGGAIASARSQAALQGLAARNGMPPGSLACVPPYQQPLMEPPDQSDICFE